MFWTCWVATYLMSARGRDDYLILEPWLGNHQDGLMKDMNPVLLTLRSIVPAQVSPSPLA